MQALAFLIGLLSLKVALAEPMTFSGKVGAQLHRYFSVCTQDKKDCKNLNCSYTLKNLKCTRDKGSKADGITPSASCQFQCAGHARHMDGPPAEYLIKQVEARYPGLIEEGMNQRYFSDISMDCEKPVSLTQGKCSLKSQTERPQMATLQPPKKESSKNNEGSGAK